MKKNKRGMILLEIAMILLAILYIYPIFVMLINSIKPFAEVIVTPLALPVAPTIENFIHVFDKMDYPRLFVNNVFITVLGLVGIIAFSSIASYILSRRKTRYTKFLYMLIITPMLIPFQSIMITLLKVMKIAGLSGSDWGLGVQYWGLGIPLAAFIYCNFMQTIPIEIDESAKIDGASTFKTFTAIIFPLLKPVTATVVILDVMWIWNDFLLPSLMVNGSSSTRTLVLAAYTFVGQFNTQWNYTMAAMTLAVLPSIIIFILLQKQIVAGVVAGAVKG